MIRHLHRALSSQYLPLLPFYFCSSANSGVSPNISDRTAQNIGGQRDTNNGNKQVQIQPPPPIVQQGFLAFFTYYHTINIDNQKLFSKTGQFETIRERHLKRKPFLAKKGGLQKSEIDQFFKAFETGKGTNLSISLYPKEKETDGVLHSGNNVVFNITSITQNVFKFCKSNYSVLMGNFGIGKTWSHLCLNHLSKMVLKCMILDDNLYQTKRLIELYSDQFKYVSEQNQNYVNADAQWILKKFQFYPIELFLQLKLDISWKEIVYNLHSQFPLIQLNQLQTITKQEQQSEQQFKIRQDKKQSYWVNNFFDNFINKIGQFKRRYNKNLKVVITIDQANIYFCNIRKLISQIQKRLKDKQLSRQHSQKSIIFQEKSKDDIYQRIFHISSIFEKLCHSQAGKTTIQLSCSDQAEPNIMNKQLENLYHYGLQSYFNQFKHQRPVTENLRYSIESNVGIWSMELWSIIWFQFQNNIIKLNKTKLMDQAQLQNFKNVIQQLQLRKIFNNLFVITQQLAKRGSYRQKNVNIEELSITKKPVTAEDSSMNTIEGINIVKPQSFFIFSVRPYSIRLMFEKKDIGDHLKQLSQLINRYKATKNKQGSKLKQQQMEQIMKKIKQQIIYSFKQFIQIFVFKARYLDRKIQYNRPDSVLRQSQTIQMPFKKTLFLIKIRDIVQRKRRLLDKINKQQVQSEIHLSTEDITELNEGIKRLIPQSDQNTNQTPNTESITENNVSLLMNSQCMKYQNGVLKITESYERFISRLQKIQLNRDFMDQYQKLFYYLDQNVDAKIFKKRIAFLLSYSNFMIRFRNYQFKMANGNKVRYLKQFNCAQDSSKIKQQLFQNLQSVETELQTIGVGQTLGFRPSQLGQQRYSENSKWFDIMLVKKTGKEKNLLITINFSFERKPNFQQKIKDIMREFDNTAIKQNNEFSSKYDYYHWFVCGDSRIKQNRDVIAQLSASKFIKAVSVKDISIQVSNVSPQLNLIASIDLKKLSNQYIF